MRVVVVVVIDSLRTVLPLSPFTGPSLSAPPFKDRPFSDEVSLDSATGSVVTGTMPGSFSESFEKKNDLVGVGVISRLSDSRLEGLTVLGLTCLISF